MLAEKGLSFLHLMYVWHHLIIPMRRVLHADQTKIKLMARRKSRKLRPEWMSRLRPSLTNTYQLVCAMLLILMSYQLQITFVGKEILVKMDVRPQPLFSQDGFTMDPMEKELLALMQGFHPSHQLLKREVCQSSVTRADNCIADWMGPCKELPLSICSMRKGHICKWSLIQ